MTDIFSSSQLVFHILAFLSFTTGVFNLFQSQPYRKFRLVFTVLGLKTHNIPNVSDSKQLYWQDNEDLCCQSISKLQNENI